MAKIPSIELIPSAFKSGKVYSVLPSDGSGDLNFARASEATRVNQNGLIEKVGSNVPRIDYKDGGCPKLLLEPQSRNLITHSEDFSNAAWSKINTTITSNAAISPSGDLSADKLVENATNNVHSVEFSGVSSALDYSRFIYAKAGERSILQITQNGVFGNFYANYDLENGTVTASAFCTASIEALNNGWYKCIITATFFERLSPITIFGIRTQIDPLANRTDTYLGDGTSGIYIWGAQLEQQSYATSYIPTNGNEVTREAETASKSGLSSYINSQEGILYFEGSALANDGTTRRISLSDGTTSNRLVLSYNPTSNEIQSFLANPTVQFNFYHTLSNSIEFNKIAVKYKQNDFALWVNGVKVATDTNGTIANGLNRLNFDEGTAASPFYGKTKAVKVYNQALTDLELEEMTGFKSFVQMANHFNYTVI